MSLRASESNAAPHYVLSRSYPEAQGVSPAAIGAFLDAIESAGVELHSLMVLRHGNVVAEGWWYPYRAETPHLLYSLSKSFTSTAIGLAIAEGLLNLDAPVVSFFPDKLPPVVSDHLAAMTVRHLLTMSTGQEESDRTTLSWDEDSDWVRDFLAQPVTAAPGSRFRYSSIATFMCSAIVHRVSGEDLLDYLMPRLFTPLGIERPVWHRSPDGTSVGGWGLSLTTESIAKFGQLYLQRGLWNGTQLVPQDWISQATSKQISNEEGGELDWRLGYGFQFWQCQHGAYRGDGAFGQFCVVCPEQDLVVAMTSSANNMQVILTALWEKVLSGLDDKPVSTENSSLIERLATLQLPGPRGDSSSAVDFLGRIFRADTSSPVQGAWTVRKIDKVLELVFQSETEQLAYHAGLEGWIFSEAKLGGEGPGPVAGKAAWSDRATLLVEFHDVASPFRVNWEFDFDGEALRVKTRYNGRFGEPEGAEFSGRIQSQ